MRKNDSYDGTGSGTISRYRSPVTPKGPSMKDGSKRGRKAAPKDYGSAASVKQSNSRTFSKGGKNPCKPSKK